MKKKTIDDIDVRGKRVLVRLDLNVPLDASRQITNDGRIRAALPTIEHLRQGGGRLILMSHLGRPKGEPGDLAKFSLAPVAGRLGELMGQVVKLVPDCVGSAPQAAVADLRDGDVCLLQNLRFHKAETIKDTKAAHDASLRECKEAFARQLADLADVYVNDAFGTCHRDNASMLTVPGLMAGKPRVIGYLIQRELRFLGEAVSNPDRPFVCVLGGAKVSDKLGVIRSLLTQCDTILIGGAMAYTFLAAEGMEVGKSLTEPDLFETARALRREAGDRLRLPVDSVVSTIGGSVPFPLPYGRVSDSSEGEAIQICEGSIAADRMGLDIGPKTTAAYRDVIGAAATLVWNGPMGVFETRPFHRGTLAIAEAVALATDRGAVSIVGGGDSAAAVEQAGLTDRITHVSTGGGASLEFLEGKPFAAIDVLDDA